MVGIGVAVGGERHDDHLGVGQQVGRREGRADQGDGRQGGGAVAGEGDQKHGSQAAYGVEVGVGQRVRDRHQGATGVLLAGLLRGEVEPAEGAELRVRQRRHLARGRAQRRERQSLGVDQLDSLGGRPSSAGRSRVTDAAGLVEGGQRKPALPVVRQLEVVELAGRGAVLG